MKSLKLQITLKKKKSITFHRILLCRADIMLHSYMSKMVFKNPLKNREITLKSRKLNLKENPLPI